LERRAVGRARRRKEVENVDSHSPGQRSSSDADRAKLAIDGGRPARTEPLPAAWPGAWVFGEEEV